MYVGIDLGGTKIAAGIVNEEGEILKRVHMPTMAKDGEDAVVNNLFVACDSLLEDGDYSPKSIGIGIPGAVRNDIGTILYTPNLPLRNVDVTSYFRTKYNCDVHLGNDANCAVLAEVAAGSCKGSKNVAMITLGTGLGGGIFVNSKLLAGISGNAGEVGHMVIKNGGRKCGCGKRGCWETYASASGLIKTALEHMENDHDSLMWELCVGMTDRLDGRTVFDAYRRDDATAILVVNDYVADLAIGIVNLMNILEPEIICVGGGVSNAWDCLEEPLTAAVEVEKFTSFASDAPKTRLVKAAMGNEAGIIGAAMLGRDIG